MAKPTPGDDEVLIKVRAASVNPLDWRLMRGKPYLIRMMSGLRKPKFRTPGRDVAGQVEAVGRNVTRFKPGDEVFGSCLGAFAEYACTPESSLVMKPENVTFDQGAAVNVAGHTALQGLRDKGKIQPGQKVLINGAAGGVGTFAVQIARAFGADVTGVCSTRNVDMVRSIGASHVIDYTQEDFTKGGQRYDVILDCHATHSLLEIRRALNPKGIYVGIGGPAGSTIDILAALVKPLVLAPFVSQKFMLFMAKLKLEDLTVIRDLMEAGKVTPIIDRRYKLSEAPEAVRYVEEGHARGKVLITLEPESAT
ncbi:MAG TPA: NAD(P)-dependent alcohol dehydrogenase [Pyrinomonadaceae bacterium]|nr:NAD(P)-dependent alcohol dehydrogenase [Pyrinomonadaceae bacterium]